MSCCDCLRIEIPGTNTFITPGCRVKLGKFETTTWLVSHGWYTWGGNRPFCGWYLTNLNDPIIIKPLQQTDLIDIYLIESGRRC